MIRFVMAEDLPKYPRLQDSMFKDRADQFVRRLGWDVSVDGNGWERDQYDALNPLYVICEGAGGRHLGSMRFLPTTGRTMIREHFSDLMEGQDICDPTIWECTRFCLGPDANPQVAGKLMSAGGEVLKGFGLTGFAGVFDERMVRIYRRIGSGPEILGQTGKGKDRISVGVWHFTNDARARVAKRSGMSVGLIEHWFKCGFKFPAVNPFPTVAV